MCHHYKSTRALPDWMVDEFSLRSDLAQLALFDKGFYPLSNVPVIRAADDAFEIVGMQWGLLPRWWKPSGKLANRRAFQRKTFNARSETAHEKPTFRDAFKRRRCLLPAAAFFEKGHYFALASGDPFCFAGLWETWDAAAGDNDAGDSDADTGELRTCTLLTTEPNDAVRAVGHPRMPVLLTSQMDCVRWIESDPESLTPLFAPFAGELISTPAED